MFEEIVNELCHEPYVKEYRTSRGCEFSTTNAQANVCAFLDSYFKGRFIFVLIF
jgi:hypothetical protein